MSTSVAAVGVGLTIAVSVSFGGGLPTGGGGGVRASKSEIRAKNDKDFNSAKSSWASKGYRIDFRARDDEDCSAHSYGKVRDFFHSNRCDQLSRAVFELRDRHQNLVLVAVARVVMPSASEAIDLQALVDKGGTGNVTELSRESGPYRSIRYTGQGYMSDRSGSMVQNIQVQPVGWVPADLIINEIRKDAPSLK